MSSCSPSITNCKTCYSLIQLKNIAKNYNKYHKQNNSDKSININQNKEYLWKELQKVNNTECKNNEYCWLKQNYMKLNANLDKYTQNFRPETPKEWKNHPSTWLNTYNILDVMKQYEDKYKKFKFIGVFPIDFMSEYNYNNKCISQEMCSLNLNNLYKKNIRRIGIIFNLDKHNQSGSHWVSLFINFNKNNKNFGAFYYDSNGISPPLEVVQFIEVIKKQIYELYNNLEKNKFKFVYNTKRHQFKGTECGMFSLYFMNECLKNINFDKFINNKKLNDDYVFQLRDKYYTKI
jgi:hypothetical protein